ncbi:MAG: hypothetical protein GOP50_04920 [Candidatus Heimdallarchaeota archaeon]|nr:hypothetical protein [Candidatus Heimdallarchaeota archaeon]
MMKMKRNITKNKKGQVFLLLAITILIYLIILSSTVYQITQSPYIEPVPNSEQLLNYVDNSLNAIEELSDIAMSQYSQGATRNDVLDIIDEGISEIDSYLDNHNLPSNISYDSLNLVIANTSTTVNPVRVRFMAEFTIHINSLDLVYDTVIYINSSYYLEYSGIAGNQNYIYIYKQRNGVLDLIDNAEVTIIPSISVANMGDGSYLADLETGYEITAVLPHNIILTLEIP